MQTVIVGILCAAKAAGRHSCARRLFPPCLHEAQGYCLPVQRTHSLCRAGHTPVLLMIGCRPWLACARTLVLAEEGCSPHAAL